MVVDEMMPRDRTDSARIGPEAYAIKISTGTNSTWPITRKGFRLLNLSERRPTTGIEKMLEYVKMLARKLA